MLIDLTKTKLCDLMSTQFEYLKYMKNIFIILISIHSVFCFSQVDDLRATVRRGIDLLYQNQKPTEHCKNTYSCPDQVNKDELVQHALNFKQTYDQIISNYKIKNLVWTKPKKRYEQMSQFQFESPMQKEGSPANTVYGYLYKPDIPDDCNVRLPATLLVHHVANDVSDEQLFASLASKMNKGITMVIYLPEYGPRKKNKNDAPFSNDMNEFKSSLLQSLTDIRIAGEILKTVEGVDTKKIQIGGLSLGALLTTVFAGIDPFFDNYLIGLGGGDLANSMTMDKNKAIGVIRQALTNIDWNKDETRKAFSDFDALTWAYTVKNKNFIFLSADDDELVDKDKSVRKLISAYKENGNMVKHFEHKGRHVPDIKTLGYTGTAKAYLKVLYRVFSFLGDNRSVEIEQCKNKYNN
jgi:hypothetical protein